LGETGKMLCTSVRHPADSPAFAAPESTVLPLWPVPFGGGKGRNAPHASGALLFRPVAGTAQPHGAIPRPTRANARAWYKTRFRPPHVVYHGRLAAHAPSNRGGMRQRATETTLMPARARSFNGIATDTRGGADVVPHSFRGVAADAPAPLGRWTLLAEFGRADLLPVRFEQDFIKEVGTLAQTRNESCLRVCRGGGTPRAVCRSEFGQASEVP
jgi:hypothetical protein